MYFQFCCTLKNVYVALYILFGGTLTKIGFPNHYCHSVCRRVVSAVKYISSAHVRYKVKVVCLQEAEILQILANIGLVKSELNEI